ncbi:head decoration protein [Paenibacillus larvae]|uniref:Head decoration protein n=1 Tax=Paenibacillus larvae TaxID=1464 RepID=A0AAP5JSQ4_9BACL|nr:head decoration protein [Paenibacillus larvae]MDT2231226.1 head decoration protein [Paenibacillus larvae]MDT2250780.1 head decoration protein [Paenibacillus larvae]
MTEKYELKYDNLIAGGVSPVVSKGETVKSGGVYLRGTVLGRITEGGKLVPVDSSKTDGSERPYAVLAETVDAKEDKAATVYLTGEFNKDALIFGGSDTVDKHEVVLREIGIFVKTTV